MKSCVMCGERPPADSLDATQHLCARCTYDARRQARAWGKSLTDYLEFRGLVGWKMQSPRLAVGNRLGLNVEMHDRALNGDSTRDDL